MQCVVIHLGHFSDSICGLHVIGRYVRMLAIEHHVIPPEQEVIGGKGIAIGPFGTCAQIKSPFGLVIIVVPAFGKARTFVQAVLHPVHR